MADEQPPPRQVVKRVVKKTVTRPTTRTGVPGPAIRYGRPVVSEETTDETTRTSVRTRAKLTAKVAKQSRAAEPRTDDPAPTRRITLPRPSVRRPSAPSLSDVKQSAGIASQRLVSAFRRLIALVTDAFWFVIDTVRSWRLPHIDAVPAALATGVIVGLLSVALGRGALEMFEWLRGVASGGGTWGSLTFVVVAFIAFVVGELLLTGFGVANPRLTSFLGVALTIVLILAVFLEESDTRMAVIVIPAVAATAFTIGHWLMAAAESGAESEE